jgi:hypothetical protein
MTMPVRLPARIRGFRSGIINEILDYLQALTPIDSRTVKHEVTVDGMRTVTTGLGDLPPGDRDWTCNFQGTSVFVNPGIVQIGGTIAEITTETEKAGLSGTPVYVYLQIPRTAKTSVTILTSNTRPNSDGTYFRFIIGIGEAVGTTYVRTRDSSGPINIDTPTS